MKEQAVDIVRRLQQAGHVAYFAGGSVRDRLLGKEAKDYDVATSAPPDEVQKLFPRVTDLTGKSFGVVRVLVGRQQLRGGHVSPGWPVPGRTPPHLGPLRHGGGGRATARLHHQRDFLRPDRRPADRLRRRRGRPARESAARHRRPSRALQRGSPAAAARDPFRDPIPLQDRARDLGGDLRGRAVDPHGQRRAHPRRTEPDLDHRQARAWLGSARPQRTPRASPAGHRRAARRRTAAAVSSRGRRLRAREADAEQDRIAQPRARAQHSPARRGQEGDGHRGRNGDASGTAATKASART